MFAVKRCVRDYEDVWKTVVAEFHTDSEACEYAAAESASSPFRDVWFEVEEE